MNCFFKSGLSGWSCFSVVKQYGPLGTCPSVDSELLNTNNQERIPLESLGF
jgi:hypothetical protein